MDRYAAALEKAPGLDLSLRRYTALKAAGNADEALRIIADRVESNPDDRGARRALAEAELERGNLQRAKAHYEKLLAGGGDATVLNNLAWVAAKLGDDRALEYAERAYALSPDTVSTLDTLGAILVENGDLATRPGTIANGASACAGESVRALPHRARAARARPHRRGKTRADGRARIAGTVQRKRPRRARCSNRLSSGSR